MKDEDKWAVTWMAIRLREAVDEQLITPTQKSQILNYIEARDLGLMPRRKYKNEELRKKFEEQFLKGK